MTHAPFHHVSPICLHPSSPISTPLWSLVAVSSVLFFAHHQGLVLFKLFASPSAGCLYRYYLVVACIPQQPCPSAAALPHNAHVSIHAIYVRCTKYILTRTHTLSLSNLVPSMTPGFPTRLSRSAYYRLLGRSTRVAQCSDIKYCVVPVCGTHLQYYSSFYHPLPRQVATVWTHPHPPCSFPST